MKSFCPLIDSHLQSRHILAHSDQRPYVKVIHFFFRTCSMINRLLSSGPANLTRIFTLVCACFPLLAHAGDAPRVYAGTLGKQPIIVELDLSTPSDVTGRYFYQKYHSDLALSGTQKGQDLTLTEGMDDDSGKTYPELHLHQNANAGWTGDWKGPDGKTQKIDLTEKAVTPPADNAEPGWQTIYEQSPYDYLRLQGLPLKASKKETVMGYNLQWWLEPVSKISFFEITSGYTPEQRARINQQLRARLWNEVVSYNACMLQGSRYGADFQQTITPELLSPDLVSVSIFTSYDCGGAHPDFGDAPLNLDANTGKELSLEDVLWVGKGKPFHYDDANITDASDDPDTGVTFETYSNYRNKELGPWLSAQFKTIAPKQQKKAREEDDECDFNDPEIWNFPSWYFTPKGIYFGPSFARAIRSCEGPTWSVLPYSVVKAHLGGVKVGLPE